MALSNGGPPGVIYELYVCPSPVTEYHHLTWASIAVSFCYWLVAASIAELASAMPSASGGMSLKHCVHSISPTSC